MTRGLAEPLDPTVFGELLISLGREARPFRFEVAPNPCVGAAVLADGQEVARGFHEAWGDAHAEVNALAAAGATDVPPERWDTLVCTLEPCSSAGKTPPCVERIKQSGIRRVVVGAVDPDPRHAGQGLELLREAGLDVIVLEGYTPLTEVAPHFLGWTSPDRLRRPHPWTVAKWAQTRTGQLSPPEDVGEGRWISGPESLAEVRVLRGRVDAIVTGIGTVLADDPRLTVRPPGDVSRAPLRIVLDSYLRTPPESRLLKQPGPDEGGGAVHILCMAGADATRHRALVDAGAQVHGLHVNEEDNLSLRDAQGWLWDLGVRRVLVEAGPRVLERYLQTGFVDQIRVYTGSVNGGRGASMAHHLSGVPLVGRADRESGPDAVLEAFVAR